MCHFYCSHEQHAVVGVDVGHQPVLPEIGHEVLYQVRHLLVYPLLHADHLPNAGWGWAIEWLEASHRKPHGFFRCRVSPGAADGTGKGLTCVRLEFYRESTRDKRRSFTSAAAEVES